MLDLLTKELDCAKQEKSIAIESENKLMQELTKMRYTLKEDIERKYLELVELKKIKERENEELKFVLSGKAQLIKDLEKRVEQAKQQ